MLHELPACGLSERRGHEVGHRGNDVEVAVPVDNPSTMADRYRCDQAVVDTANGPTGATSTPIYLRSCAKVDRAVDVQRRQTINQSFEFRVAVVVASTRQNLHRHGLAHRDLVRLLRKQSSYFNGSFGPGCAEILDPGRCVDQDHANSSGLSRRSVSRSPSHPTPSSLRRNSVVSGSPTSLRSARSTASFFVDTPNL